MADTEVMLNVVTMKALENGKTMAMEDLKSSIAHYEAEIARAQARLKGYKLAKLRREDGRE